MHAPATPSTSKGSCGAHLEECSNKGSTSQLKQLCGVVHTKRPQHLRLILGTCGVCLLFVFDLTGSGEERERCSCCEACEQGLTGRPTGAFALRDDTTVQPLWVRARRRGCAERKPACTDTPVDRQHHTTEHAVPLSYEPTHLSCASCAPHTQRPAG